MLNAPESTTGMLSLCLLAETKLGIVPDNAVARQFRDIGMFNQQVAAIANRVVLVVAGQPLIIKDDSLSVRAE